MLMLMFVLFAYAVGLVMGFGLAGYNGEIARAFLERFGREKVYDPRHRAES